VRPSLEILKDFKMELAVEQVVYFMSFSEYKAQQVQYNLTIQATVASSLDGVTPDAVTDIVVGNAALRTASAHTRGAVSLAGTNSACLLAYKVTVHDPVLKYDDLRAQLIQSANSGGMDVALHHYASVYGATQLSNCTFSVPMVANVYEHTVSSKLTGVQIAGLVIGVVLAVALIGVFAAFLYYRKE
jgi:hypothetical protein